MTLYIIYNTSFKNYVGVHTDILSIYTFFFKSRDIITTTASDTSIKDGEHCDQREVYCLEKDTKIIEHKGKDKHLL